MPLRPADIAEELVGMRHQLASWGWPDDYLVEHAIDERLAVLPNQGWGHSAHVFTPPTYLFRLVIFHAPACGCNTIPDEVVLHG